MQQRRERGREISGVCSAGKGQIYNEEKSKKVGKDLSPLHQSRQSRCCCMEYHKRCTRLFGMERGEQKQVEQQEQNDETHTYVNDAVGDRYDIRDIARFGYNCK